MSLPRSEMITRQIIVWNIKAAATSSTIILSHSPVLIIPFLPPLPVFLPISFLSCMYV
jgi:hypothetical protein